MALRVTYVATDNSAGDGQVLGDQDQDILVKKVIFGSPADGIITNFYNKRISTGDAAGMGSVSTTDLVLQITQPTAAAGLQIRNEVDFTTAEGGGLPLDGGSFHTNGTDTTVIWEPLG